MIVWSKSKASIPEPSKVITEKLDPSSILATTPKQREKDFLQMRRRQWAEANPILYDGLIGDRVFRRDNRVRNAKRIFSSVLHWGKFQQFIRKASKEEVIDKLKQYTSVKVKAVAGYRQRRKKNISIKLENKCVACRGKAEVVHHIVMIVNGGPNIRRNTVPLCNPCHALVHPWIKIV